MGLKQTIKSLDAFPRAEEHLLQKTQTGAFGNMRGHGFSLCIFSSTMCYLTFMLLYLQYGGKFEVYIVLLTVYLYFFF